MRPTQTPFADGEGRRRATRPSCASPVHVCREWWYDVPKAREQAAGTETKETTGEFREWDCKLGVAVRAASAIRVVVLLILGDMLGTG